MPWATEVQEQCKKQLLVGWYCKPSPFYLVDTNLLSAYELTSQIF